MVLYLFAAKARAFTAFWTIRQHRTAASTSTHHFSLRARLNNEAE